MIVTYGKAVLGTLIFIGILTAQSTPRQAERFEVASIRPSTTTGVRPTMEFTPGGGVRATNVTLKWLIQMAYDVRSEQVSGGPGWTDAELYTVIAKGPEGGPVLTATAQQELGRKRLQALLAERFHLELRREANVTTGYSLTVGKAATR
jgi:uncharacterized protein (TIGR03435 family)